MRLHYNVRNFTKKTKYLSFFCLMPFYVYASQLFVELEETKTKSEEQCLKPQTTLHRNSTL